MTGRVLPEGLAEALHAAGLEPAGPLGPAPGGDRWVALDRTGVRWVVTVVETPAVGRLAAVRARAEHLGRIDHPHLAQVGPVLDLGRHAVAVLHREVPGTDLATVHAGRGVWAPGEVATVVVPLAEALAALHAAGLVHGDVAAANVVLDPEGRAVLVDLVCGDGPDERGTPGVAAPERPRCAHPAGDVHALSRLGLALLSRLVDPPHEDDPLPEAADLDAAARSRLTACLTAGASHDPDLDPTPRPWQRRSTRPAGPCPSWCRSRPSWPGWRCGERRAVRATGWSGPSGRRHDPCGPCAASTAVGDHEAGSRSGGQPWRWSPAWWRSWGRAHIGRPTTRRRPTTGRWTRSPRRSG